MPSLGPGNPITPQHHLNNDSCSEYTLCRHRHESCVIGTGFALGRLTPLRLAWQNRRLQPLVSKNTGAELIRVLKYPKFKLSTGDQQELLADYLPYCLSINIPNPPPATPDCRDSFNLPFLQLAIASQADFLVTDDQDLLSLADGFACPILNAEQFLKILDI